MQTSVLNQMPIGVAGQLADLHTEEFGDVMSATSQEASAEIPFGVMVQPGTSDDGVKLLSGAGGTKMGGVVVFSNSYDAPVQLGSTGLKPGVTFDRLRKGRIIVLCEEAVVANTSAVHVRHTTATTEQVGAFRATASAGKTFTLTGAKWLTSAGAGEPAVLEVDLDVMVASAD